MPTVSPSQSCGVALHDQVTANLTALIESTEDLVWSVDMSFRVLICNSAFRRYMKTHYGCDEVIGKTAEELLPPERAATWTPLIGRVLAEGVFRAEIPFAGGRLLEVSFNTMVVDGRTVGVSLFGKDISERRAAADAQALLASVVESSHDSIVAVRLDGEIAGWNRGAEMLFGYTRAEALGKRVAMLHPPSREHEVRNLIAVLLKGGVLEPYSTFLRGKDGQDIECSLSLSPIRDASGIIVGVSGIARDLRERKRVDGALEASEKRYRELFDGALEGMFQATPAGRALCANVALAKMLGYDSPDQFVEGVSNAGQSLWVDPSERARCMRLIDEFGFIRDFEAQLKRRDGTQIWVSVTWRKIPSLEHGIVLEGFVEDITERKRTEMELRESGHFLQESQRVGELGSYTMNLLTGAWSGSDVMDKIMGVDSQYEHTLAGWRALVHPDDRGMLDEYFAREVLEQKRNFDKAYRIVRPCDGETRAVYGAGSLELDDEGRPVKLRGVVKDVTETKLAEQAIRDSQQFAQATMDALSTALCVVDRQGTVIAVNRAWREFGEANCGVARGGGAGSGGGGSGGARSSGARGGARDSGTGHGANYLDVCDRAIGRERADAAAFAAGIRAVLGGEMDQFSHEYPCHSATEQRWFIGRVTRFFAPAMSLDLDRKAIARVVIEHIDITALKLGEASFKEVGQRLRMSEERYRSTFEQAPIGIIHTSTDGYFLRCNARFAEIIGYPQEQVQGMHFRQITDAEDLPESLSILSQVRSTAAQQVSFEKRYVRKDCSRVWVKITTSAQYDAQGRIVHHITLVEDINALKAAEERLDQARGTLQLTEERYRRVFQTSFDGIAISDVAGRCIDANPRFLQMMALSLDEAVGKTDLELNIWVDVGDRERMGAIMSAQGQVQEFEAQFRNKTGAKFWVLLSASVSDMDGTPCVTTIARDISAAKAAEEEIRSLAFYDPLTALPNRRLLLERLQQAVTMSRRTGNLHALLFLDLDNFKNLNDTLGHQTGDLLLQETARRLEACVRESDTVGRLGGDEFLLMLQDLSKLPEEAAAQAQVVGEKILAAMSRGCLLKGREYRSSASIGIAVFGDRRETTSEVLQQADMAMYQAKSAGRNTMRFFAPALQAAVNTRAQMEEELRRAVECQQFELYYQPQVHRTRLMGAEALIRWHHPSGKLLAPGEFIPLAEETGLILPIGKWVLEQACRQIVAWAGNRRNARLSIAVNISARQFRQPEFVGDVLEALARTGANPRNLGIELTESILVDDVDGLIEKMKELKEYGLRFSLDDFGTGYSSLSYLKKLPLSELKIDRSFIRDILTEESSAAIAQTIISLSRAMGLPVIAEGVETEEQRQFLTVMGCYNFQGYLFGRPLAMADFEKQWLTPASSEKRPGARVA
jgi:diguanylate cyclase (GGDEF)-like protein/PAS domain S-box-containing protein